MKKTEREKERNKAWLRRLKTLQCMKMQLANDSTVALLSLIKRIRWKDFVNPLLMENYYLNAALYSLAFFFFFFYFFIVFQHYAVFHFHFSSAYSIQKVFFLCSSAIQGKHKKKEKHFTEKERADKSKSIDAFYPTFSFTLLKRYWKCNNVLSSRIVKSSFLLVQGTSERVVHNF